MARQRKVVDMQTAHLTQKEKQKKKAEEREIITGNEALDKPPAWLLNADAKKRMETNCRRIEKDRTCRKSGLCEFGMLLQCICELYKGYSSVKKGAVLHRTRDQDRSDCGEKSSDRYTNQLCCRDAEVCWTMWNDS